MKMASATMNTFFKRIMGSGRTKSDAISNAITNVRSGDQDIINFFADSKKKIDAYYKAHCKEVLQEANQALAMKDYAQINIVEFFYPQKRGLL
jgi:2C-methyl-D-erythritol 2,4-cyclodiphosphate synthase